MSTRLQPEGNLTESQATKRRVPSYAGTLARLMKALRTLQARGVSSLESRNGKSKDAVSMIRILQIYVHRSGTVHELLTQIAAEIEADLVLISEQHRNKDPA